MKRASVTQELAYGSALDRLTGTDRTEAPVKRGEPPPPPSDSVSLIKLSVFLKRDEDAYLEGLAATAKFSGGKKLSKTKLVESMVHAFSTTGLDVRGVSNYEELYERVIAQLRR
jgi:hypothetical protein